MSLTTDRPYVRVGDITFDLNGSRTLPEVEIDGGQRRKTKEPIGEDAPVVVQILGPKAKEVTITGLCSKAEAGRVDDLDQEPVVTVRSDRFSGEANPHTTNTYQAEGINDDGFSEYRFRIELTEIVGGASVQRS
ncbi:hypothetical protein SAMN05216388_101792 [Halorientalis persicus]|uniref:Phage tail tube protein n=1 Tax=Halorientalis persicus TaxID=1367881 RepID=A0A1H8S083_9EURY|nr:hypothetical protein [Halorientalis persicus]SEO71758.1 hypothetical protein SAMN05216388_101792 [Halorientalis persicus]